MKKETKKTALAKSTRFAFFCAVLLLLAAGAVYGYLFVTIQNIGGNTAEIVAETVQLSEQEATVGVLKSNLAATQEKQSTIHSYFIDASDIVPFLETVEGYGRSTGVKVTFGAVQIKPTPASLDVSLSATGTFTALYQFVALLEAAPYEIGINTAAIDSAPSDVVANAKGPPPPSNWQGDISLSVYSINE